MSSIALSQGYVAIVDDEDYGWLSQWKWHALIGTHACYAVRNVAGGYGKQVYMHREILGTAPGVLTDHRDGNGLNNQRANLRQCTSQENNRNSRSHVGSSLYKGVCWDRQHQKWRAGIRVDGRTLYLGIFSVEAEAADAYKAAAEIAHGEFAAGARGDRR